MLTVASTTAAQVNIGAMPVASPNPNPSPTSNPNPNLKPTPKPTPNPKPNSTPHQARGHGSWQTWRTRCGAPTR
jgi:hypothetical protein